METLCAFLNGKGGTILFGVTDKGKIIGQEVSDQTKRIVADALQRLEPLAAVEISYIPLSDNFDKKIIAIHVEEQRYTRPFIYKGRSIHTNRKYDFYNAPVYIQSITHATR